MTAADEVARKYLTRATIKDTHISSACPFHKGGKERRPSFWVSRRTGSWGCFACNVGGSSLKKLLKELGVRSLRIEQEIDEAEKEAKKNYSLEQAKKRKKDRSDFRGEYILPEAVLGVFDFLPVGMIKSGFTEKILYDHCIGYDKRNRRITFPIRDIYGNLIGISGRATGPTDFPKYKLYSGPRDYDSKTVIGELGEWFPDYSNEGVRDNLWRGEKVYDDLFQGKWDQLILVEGFKAALWLVQCGWPYTVAIMGTKMTRTQARVISRLGVTVFVLADNNEPGRVASRYWCQTLAVNSFPVYEVSYPGHCDEEAQPDDLSEEELETALECAKRIGGIRYARKNSAV